MQAPGFRLTSRMPSTASHYAHQTPWRQTRPEGATPGKRLFGIRVVSLFHEHISPWHSIERALGYSASALVIDTRAPETPS